MTSLGINIILSYETDKSKILPYSNLTSFDSGKTQVLFQSTEFSTEDEKNLNSLYHDRLKNWYPDTYRKIAKSYNMDKDIWNGSIVQNIENFMRKLMDNKDLNIIQIKETIGANGYPYYIIKYKK